MSDLISALHPAQQSGREEDMCRNRHVSPGASSNVSSPSLSLSRLGFKIHTCDGTGAWDHARSWRVSRACKGFDSLSLAQRLTLYQMRVMYAALTIPSPRNLCVPRVGVWLFILCAACTSVLGDIFLAPHACGLAVLQPNVFSPVNENIHGSSALA
ncbi:hypothetical protein BU26DRAFT_515033 [Trematosphaeria pertusa]|uniref:Uncharacterized protein n=1 Tax=Trematosphaeria pertusa TaxID=390896 RepID=A0A6A6IY66_9PLEO|nr:uncharacterized protein BU26DRAFT_515033 [Trematosphaeria pertusa]KAF2255306.1 hypothetical protein BU26DRAFT_515033 [Trematosphaeria pertusa]